MLEALIIKDELDSKMEELESEISVAMLKGAYIECDPEKLKVKGVNFEKKQYVKYSVELGDLVISLHGTPKKATLKRVMEEYKKEVMSKVKSRY